MRATFRFFPLAFLPGVAALACRQDVVGPVRGIPGVADAVAVSGADPAIAYGLQTGSWFTVKYWVGVMNSDGSHKTTLVASTDNPHPAWSPDGHSIVYHAVAYGISRVDVSLVNGTPVASTPVRLPISHQSFDMEWSPDPAKEQIAYTEDIIGASAGLWLAPSKPVVPYVETSVYQTPPNQRLIWLAWNPQATKIAVIQRSRSAPVDTLFVVDLTTSPARATPVRAFARGVLGLSWSRTQPDRLALAVPVTTTSSGYQASILDLSTNTLSNDPGGPNAGWSPDDSKLVCSTFAPKTGVNTISVLTFNTGTSVTLGSGVQPEWRRAP